MKKMIALLVALVIALGTLPAMAIHTEDDGLPFIIRFGSRDEKRIAVTVDDCYDAQMVRNMLDLAKQHEIPFTFFPLGACLKEKDADLWRDMVDSGCEIGTHTYSHQSLGLMNARAIKNSLGRAQETLDRVLGYHYQIKTLRPPYGKVHNAAGSSSVVRPAVQKMGFKHVINWDVSQTDPNLAIHQVQNGSILLYHANPKDYRCLEQLIPQLKDRGFAFATVSDLLGFEGPTIGGELYVYDYTRYE